MSRRSNVAVFVTLFLVMMMATRCWAQAETARVSGQITDAGGSVVPRAEIRIVNLETGVTTAGTSNEDGIYSIVGLIPGRYRLTFQKAGFREVIVDGLTLNVQDVVAQNVQLQVGSVSETVTVEAGGININTTDATVSTVISHELVDNLPLNGRTFQQLYTLTPGVNLIGSTGSGGATPTGEFSVNGQRATSNYFTVDGVSANIGLSPGSGGYEGATINGVGNAAGGTNAMVSVDALQEFRILTSSFAPEYGRTPGGQVILLTRSGTNQFHGSLYDYFRNTVLDANDWFSNQAGVPRSPLQFNDFGGTLGGPIFKDKTFFFFSYEGQRLLQPEFAITSVPDEASRSAASPATQLILNAFPLSNGPELGNGLAQFSAGYSNRINTNATSIRLDHNFSSQLNLFGRYSYAPSFNATRNTALTNLANILTTSPLAQTLTLGATYSFTPRLVDELRFNFGDNSIGRVYTQDAFGGAIPPPPSAIILPPNSPTDAVGRIFALWPATIYEGTFGRLQQRQINLVNSFSWSVGSHQLKFGFDYLRQLPIYAGLQEYNYAFKDVDSIVTNTPLLGNFNYRAPLRNDLTEFSLYAQDAWHFSSRLTLTYGLRWDLNPPPHSRYPNNQDYLPAYVNSAGGLTFGQVGSSYWNTQYSNFAPRLGIAYVLRQSPAWETVVRGGIGLFYDIGSQAAPGFNSEIYPVLQEKAVTSNVSFPLTPQQLALPPVNLSNPPPGSSFEAFSPNFSSPRVWQWNVSMQQALGSAQALTVSYVAALGRDLVYPQEYGNVTSQDYYIESYNNAGTSDYQALQLQFQRRFSHGLSATAAYTWAHSIDTNSDNLSNYSTTTTSVGVNNNRGSSDFDIRNNFSGAVSYSIPGYAGGWAASLSRGWGIDAIITARSALPLDILEDDLTAYGYYYYLRPNVVPGVPFYLPDPNVPGGRIINAAAFVANPNGQGDLGRNVFRGFDLVETDLSARRSFHLSERLNLLFRADLFNLFNHPNFANPNGILGTSFFGQATTMANNFVGGTAASGNMALNSVFQAGGPRTVQFSLKLQF